VRVPHSVHILDISQGRLGQAVLDEDEGSAGYRGQHAGSFGRAAFFSTEEKTITSGDGGGGVTDDPALARQLEAFRLSCAPPSASDAARCLLKVVVCHLITTPRLHPHTRPLHKRLRSRYIAPGARRASRRAAAAVRRTTSSRGTSSASPGAR
jgi:hypothetical protein